MSNLGIVEQLSWERFNPKADPVLRSAAFAEIY